jgi:hypothetical protein
MQSIDNLPNGEILFKIGGHGHFYKEKTILKHVPGTEQLAGPPKQFTDVPSDMALAVSVNDGGALMWIEDKFDFAEAIRPNDTREKVWLHIPLAAIKEIFHLT